MSNSKYYATISRSNNENSTGTKVRLKIGKHGIVLSIANDPLFLQKPGVDIKPVHIMKDKDWDKISGELKIGNQVGFTTIFKGTEELFTLCNRETKKDIENAQRMMREKEN